MNNILDSLLKMNVKEWIKFAIKVVCVIICLFFILNIFFLDAYSLKTYKQVKKDLNKKTTSNAKISATITELEKDIDRLKNDPFYIESIARRDYKMVKKGEIVYIFNR